MRVLILGGDGMLGHRLLKNLSRAHDARVTLRRERAAYASLGLFNERNSYAGVDLRILDRLTSVFSECKPEAVINAAGALKRPPTGLDPVANIEINALLPHRLAAICREIGAHLVHISTDGVFSGRAGNYNEECEPDPVDPYGHAKLLGEVAGPKCITLRTSIVGRELARKTGLLEWFLAQKGQVRGYKNVIYTGFTTPEMSRIIEKLITRYPDSSGTYHVSSDPISKFDLLRLVRDKLGLAVNLVPDDEFRCDLSLDSTRFRRDFSYAPPSWDMMLDELVSEIRGSSDVDRKAK
jgi:dTDP-4-dehydrorhamnose reductase